MKIWNQHKNDQSSSIDKFLSGEDIVLDQGLFLYDIDASIAHAHELHSLNILHKKETQKIVASLKKLAKLFKENKFKLTDKYEDCHSAIESFLTKELGSIGKKIHTGRSRNDQVMVAMRLYAIAKLNEIDSSGMNDPIELKETEINKIMKNSNSNFEPLVLQDGVIYVSVDEGNGTPIDLSTDESIIDFVVSNIGKGIGDDAKMVLRQQLKGLKTSSSTSKPINLTEEEQAALF